MIFLIVALMCFGMVGWLVAGVDGLLIGVIIAGSIIIGLLLLCYAVVHVLSKDGFRIDG